MTRKRKYSGKKTPSVGSGQESAPAELMEFTTFEVEEYTYLIKELGYHHAIRAMYSSKTMTLGQEKTVLKNQD